MGKKKSKKLRLCSGNMPTNVENVPEPDYKNKVGNLADVGDFKNVQCPANKEEVMTSGEPIFFMGNSFCNIPSPISIPKHNYLYHFEEAARATVKNNRIYPTVVDDTPNPYLMHELKCSITNLLISSLTECISHILNSDIFVKPPIDGIPLRNDLLNYQRIFDMVDRRLGGDGNLRKALRLFQVNSAVAVHRYFTASISSISTQIFADLANEYANNLASLCPCQLNTDSLIIHRIIDLNSVMEYRNPQSGRNILFAAIFAMFTNYTWSFSGMADVEIGRIFLEAVKCNAVYDNCVGNSETDNE